MRLLNLLQESSVWYHGSPESQNIGDAFEQRTNYVSVISDPEKWKQLQDKANSLEAGSDEYMDTVTAAGDLRVSKPVRSAIFLSDDPSVSSERW